MAGSIAIFRIDSAGQTEATANAAGQVIEFNGGLVPDNTGRIVEPGLAWARGVNFHPNPRRPLDKIQDGLLSFKEVILSGHTNLHNATVIPDKLDEWFREPATNASLPFGRFGVRSDGFGTASINLTPNATQGYILYEGQATDVETPKDQVSIIAKLYRNGDP